jgi:MarR family transcriptional regulator for hemolysin
MTEDAQGDCTDLLFLLAQASHVLETEMTAALAELGVSPRAYCVLSSALIGELTQSQLAEMTTLDKTTMVVTLDELEKAGLAERQASPTDRRARIISVTELGQKIVEEGAKVVAALYEDVLSVLPAGERQVFVSALARLAGGRLSRPVRCDRPVRRRSPKA